MLVDLEITLATKGLPLSTQ